MFRFLTTVALVTLTALVLTLSSPPAYAANDWEQVGLDIDGEANGNQSGYSVALSNDGSIVAVGEWRTASLRGQVRVFELSGGSWVQKGSSLAGEAVGDYFGGSVSLSNDGLTLAVGAPENDGNGTSSGHVRVFTFSGGDWVQRTPDIDGASGNDLFGSAVALSGDGAVVAVGAPTDANINGDASAGQVTVFSHNGTTWVQRGARGQMEGVAFGDQAGRVNSVANKDDGSTVAVGSRTRDIPGSSNVGSVEVYDYDGSAWGQRGATQYGDNAEDRLGYAVALNASGSVVAAGAIFHDVDSLSNAGRAHVFEWGSGSWTQRGADIPGDGANDQFGISVALNDSGDRLIVGAILHDTGGTNSGRASVFEYSSATWTQLGLSIDGQTVDENFGNSVAISGTGATIAIGGQNGTNTNPGWTRIYAYPTPAVAGGSESSQDAGLPGIYLHVAGPVGRLAEGSPVYYGSDRVAITSTYLLTITNATNNTTSRVLAEGVVDARGNLEARALLPSLQPGDYDVVFQGKHRGGAGLRLSARITVGDAGQIMTLGPNIPTVW